MSPALDSEAIGFRVASELSAVNPAYFDTRFERQEAWEDPPAEFAIITAYATTGEEWSSVENEAADKKLETELRGHGRWLRRLTGYSPVTGHTEPGWAVGMPFTTACDLGLRFQQDAIYYVTGGTLSVSRCDKRRALVEVGAFSSRVDDACGGKELATSDYHG